MIARKGSTVGCLACSAKDGWPPITASKTVAGLMEFRRAGRACAWWRPSYAKLDRGMTSLGGYTWTS
jgi:hypothetical protein